MAEEQIHFVHKLNGASRKPVLTIEVSKEETEGNVGLVVPKPVRALASPTKSKRFESFKKYLFCIYF